jgi:hypothetical protein
MFLTNEIIVKNGSINGWTIEEDKMSGIITFIHPLEDVHLFATPNWDEEGYVPFAIEDGISGEYFPMCNSLKLEGSLEEQLSEYVKVVTYLTNVLK